MNAEKGWKTTKTGSGKSLTTHEDKFTNKNHNNKHAYLMCRWILSSLCSHYIFSTNSMQQVALSKKRGFAPSDKLYRV